MLVVPGVYRAVYTDFLQCDMVQKCMEQFEETLLEQLANRKFRIGFKGSMVTICFVAIQQAVPCSRLVKEGNAINEGVVVFVYSYRSENHYFDSSRVTLKCQL